MTRVNGHRHRSIDLSVSIPARNAERPRSGYFVASIRVARRFSRPSTGRPTVMTSEPSFATVSA